VLKHEPSKQFLVAAAVCSYKS